MIGILLATAVAVVAPSLPQPTGADIVAVQLQNRGAAALPSRIVTFGQAFRHDDLPAEGGLIANVPVQLDAKATHPDGSIRHGLVSVLAPAMAPGSSFDIMLRRGTAPAARGLSPAGVASSHYDLQLAIDQGAGDTIKIDAEAFLLEAISKGKVETWLRGPLVSEYRVRAPINTRLEATFDIRAAADGTITTDVIVSNDFAYKSPMTYRYDATIISHGQVLWQAKGIEQHKFQTWHHVVGDVPRPGVVFNVPYLEAAGAVPAFDTSLGVDAKALQDAYVSMQKADTGPLGKALVTPYMPMTGGRDDIGMVPNWTANYLVSQDPQALAVMLANADASGSVPWHAREADGKLLTARRHPQLWLDDRCATDDCLPGGFDSVGQATGWALDNAHEPDLAYVPYLVTGSHYYLDQLQDEAAWELLTNNPAYRGGRLGLVYPSDQIRGVAWNIRDIANAAWITPKDDFAKAYLSGAAEHNVASLITQPEPAVGALHGFLYDGYHPASIAPWQQDFLAMTLSEEVRRGVPGAAAFAGTMVNFVAGRFLHGAEGYNPLHGPAYWPNYVDQATNQPASTWSAFYAMNFPGPAPTQLDGYPAQNGGYAAAARAATASLYSATRSPDALKAYAWLVRETPAMPASFQQGQFYDISPILRDGHTLRNSEIEQVHLGVAATHHDHDLLIGGDDACLLRVNDSQAYVVVGNGKAEVVIETAPRPWVTVIGLKLGVDHIHLESMAGTIDEVLASRQADGDGTVLRIGSRILSLPDLAPEVVTASMFN